MSKHIEVGKDILPRYLSMGHWRSRQIQKRDKGRSERTRLGRVYVARPPITGWLGGLPENNGYRPGGRK